jgi:Holliday junction resolvase RusA-like endonuclease
VKVLDLTAGLCGINKKYTIARCKCRQAQLILSKDYRNTKEDLARCISGRVDNATKVTIHISTAKDIDAVIKIALDALELKGTISNDSQITELHVHKTKSKRGTEDDIKIWVE